MLSMTPSLEKTFEKNDAAWESIAAQASADAARITAKAPVGRTSRAPGLGEAGSGRPRAQGPLPTPSPQHPLMLLMLVCSEIVDSYFLRHIRDSMLR